MRISGHHCPRPVQALFKRRMSRRWRLQKLGYAAFPNVAQGRQYGMFEGTHQEAPKLHDADKQARMRFFRLFPAQELQLQKLPKSINNLKEPRPIPELIVRIPITGPDNSAWPGRPACFLYNGQSQSTLHNSFYMSHTVENVLGNITAPVTPDFPGKSTPSGPDK